MPSPVTANPRAATTTVSPQPEAMATARVTTPPPAPPSRCSSTTAVAGPTNCVRGRTSSAAARTPSSGFPTPESAPSAGSQSSRRHLEIRWDGQVALLSDLNSTNGTTVNNAPVQEWQLADGDVIRLGHSEIIVRVH